MQLIVFNYHEAEEQMLSEIKTVEINDEIWFVASDVCKVLEIANARDAVSSLDDDEKLLSTLPMTGHENKVTLINESGLYNLIFTSKKSSAQMFRKWITKEVIPSIRRKGFYGKIDRTQLPNFITRYKDNYHKLPANYFSVISEMFARLYMEFEKLGYQIPDKGQDGKQLMPDISVGRGFAKYLRDIESEFYDQHKQYIHTFPDGKEVEANMYHIDAIPVFIRYIHERWIPENALGYFKKRDPLALEYLPKLLHD